MRGVVAAGDPATAEAAAGALRAGGNAVDAAIAGCAAAFAAEPLLASPGGAGVMTVALPGREPAVVDFFSDAPGLLAAADSERGRAGERERDNSEAAGGQAGLDFRAIEVDFGTCAQLFHVGRGAAAVPGALPGLRLAHERFGSLPLADLVAPGERLARDGVRVSASTARVFGLLRGLVTAVPATAAVLAPGGAMPRAGDVLVNPDLADTLRAFGAEGRVPDRLWDGLLAGFGPARGGLITEADVRAYAPRVVAPLHERIGGWDVHLPPVAGGALAGVILRALAGGAAAAEADEVVRLARASAAGHAARPAAIARTQTTHISAMDAAGGAAAVTLTNGEGCGHLIAGTGVHVNNFLGEEDLSPGGFHRHAPGRRMPTMVSPAVCLRDGAPALALGSGGANRIRTAVGQVLYRVIAGAAIADAVLAPRVHAEGDDVWLELDGVREPAAAVRALEADFVRVHAFGARDFFFGGVNAVAAVDGELLGVGDPRRAGASLVV